MPTAVDAIDAAIQEVTRARTRVSRIRQTQIRGADDVAMLKATAHAWFHTHRPIVESTASHVDLTAADEPYTKVLNSTAKYAARTTYMKALKDAKDALIAMRADAMITPLPAASKTDDLPPDFSPLAGNQTMREILTRRWQECHRCVEANAHLAAIVMMGGLLEALFVARANKMLDKKPLINAAAAPKDKTGKTLNYQDWMLDSYIKVAHELRWITASGRSVADVLKEYRNYVHPEKELRHGVKLEFNDSSMLWQVTKELARQLLLSISD